MLLRDSRTQADLHDLPNPLAVGYVGVAPNSLQKLKLTRRIYPVLASGETTVSKRPLSCFWLFQPVL